MITGWYDVPPSFRATVKGRKSKEINYLFDEIEVIREDHKNLKKWVKKYTSRGLQWRAYGI